MAIEEVPMTPDVRAVVKARASNAWGLTGAQIGATGGIMLVCVAAILGGAGSGQLWGFVLAAAAALFLAFVGVVTYYVVRDRRRPLEEDVGADHYLRASGPMRFTDARQADSDAHVWDVDDQTFAIRDDVGKRVRDLTAGSVDYTENARLILVVRDAEGNVRYRHRGL